MRRVEPHQLSFAFADSPKGSGHSAASDVSEAKAWLLLRASDKEAEGSTAQADGGRHLLAAAASVPNLARALVKVAQNKGAAGVDGRSVNEVVESARTLLPRLRHALLCGCYEPGEIRRVWIPKPGGQGQRGLGIPNVVDRWVQQAVLQVVEPIFEPTFHASSHGFRPRRGARTAIAEAKGYVSEGCDVVVDIDLAKFFDCVNHQRLLSRLAEHFEDRRLLRLIARMLRAKVVLPDGTHVSNEQGTPQGGPLSPLLSNIVLNELDWELDRRGLRFVRYADDCNIYVRSERAGHRVLASIRRFIEGRLRLTVNETKSSVTRADRLHFLGFRLARNEAGAVEVHVSTRTRDRMTQRIRAMTPRMWGRSLGSCIERLNRYLTGWTAYFGLCGESEVHLLRRFDAHVRRRLRAIIVRQKKRPRHLYRHLRSRGVSSNMAAQAAFRRLGVWRQSNTPGLTRAYGNAWFHERLVSLATRWAELNGPSRVSTGQLLLFG